MFERTGRDGAGRTVRAFRVVTRTRPRPAIEPLEARALLAASLAPIPDLVSPQALGFQLPLDGSGSGSPAETFSVTSSNPAIKATIAKGKFLTLNVTHASANATDPAFSGTLTFQLFDDLTPLTAARIEQLVTSGFYNGRNFHRISAGFPDTTHFIAQGGSVDNAGHDSPPAIGQPGGLPGVGFPFPDEFNQQVAFTGTYQLAMANAGPNTNSSQFFVTTGSPRQLDFHHTIFGELVSGVNVLTQMTKVATSDGTTPTSPILIKSATLTDQQPYGVVHIDTTGATSGQSGTLTVTATDQVTLGTVSKSFLVNVGPTPGTTTEDPKQNERAFVDPIADQTVGLNQTDVFQAVAHNAEPADTLTYTVKGGVDPTTGAFTDIQNATATVGTDGVVSVVPKAGFAGTIPLLIGVRDQVNRSTSTADTASNFQWHTLTLTVNPTATPVNLVPIALPVTAATTTITPTTIQLNGNSANPGSSQTITYAITTPPAHGMLSAVNAAAGTVTYTANVGYAGPDSFAYTVTDAGAPTPNLTSAPATVSINVTSGMTNAVRLIGRVLVVTPPAPLKGQANAIDVTETGGQVHVTVNGILDAVQPQVSALDRIVVYGTNRNTSITIDPSVTLPTTLDGGHGGKNVIIGGGPISRVHAWFGKNTVTGGSGENDIVGRKGHVTVKKSAGTDSVYLSNIDPYHRPSYTIGFPFGQSGLPTSPGNFYKFVGNHLVKTNRPSTVKLKQS